MEDRPKTRMGYAKEIGMERRMETDMADWEEASVGHGEEGRVGRGEGTNLEDCQKGSMGASSKENLGWKVQGSSGPGLADRWGPSLEKGNFIFLRFPVRMQLSTKNLKSTNDKSFLLKISIDS